MKLRRSIAVWVFSFGVLGTFAGCASEALSPPQTSPLTHCVPNQTLVCLCGLQEGTQVCNEAGELTPCNCEDYRPPSVAPTTPTPTSNARCGNGMIEPGEACDDGNLRDNDGCSSACTPDGAPKVARECPGQLVTLWPRSTVTIAGQTKDFENTTSSSCRAAPGPDRTYTLIPEADGVISLDASFGSEFDAVVSIREQCSDASEIVCEESLGAPIRRVFPVVGGHPYHLIVDSGTLGNSGPFVIHAELL